MFMLDVAMLCLCCRLLCYVYAVGCYAAFMLDVAMLCLSRMLLCYVYAVGCYAVFICCVPVLPLSSVSLTSAPADTKYWSTESCPSL